MIDPTQNVIIQFARIVGEHAHDTAIAGGRWEPTFRELDDVSTRLACEILHRLDRINRPFEDSLVAERIVLLMAHDAPLLAAMIAILKAGRVIVALNSLEPVARLQSIVAGVEPSLIITDSERAPLAEKVGPGIPVTVYSPSVSSVSAASLPTPMARGNDVACLVHTSGTTGRPKGVMRTHGQILDSVRRYQDSSQARTRQRVLALASLSTGQGQSTAWTALLRGATLLPFSAADRGITGLEDFIVRHQIQVYISSVSLFRCLVSTLETRCLESVRLVRLGSEPPTMSDFLAFRRHFRNDCFLTNALSSSEAGVIAQWQYNPSDPKTDPACGGEIRLESDRLPIGRAVSGMDLRLIDEAGNEVPPGQPGEVIVRSPHISVGYWRDPETTARHFTIDPTTGVTTFRGGDVLKQLSDGTLVFAGRSDTRLKVRGYRIEPSDVERVILSLPGVESASVGPVMGPSSEPMLVAYFKPTLGSDNDLRSLRSQMRQQLPDYMMPARFIRIDHWPLSASGKVDRHQLFSRPLPDDSDDNEGQPTQTDSERQLQSIWQRVFQRASIDRNTHFFEIGGDSLLAAIISAHVYAESGIEIPLRSFSDHPVLSDLAAFIADRQRSSDDGDLPLTKVPRTQPLPLSPAQESIWKECAAHSRSDGWTIVQRHRLTGDLNTTILTDCLKHMLERHEILRTTFTIHQGRPSAHIHAMAENTCVFLDFSDASQATEAADTRVLESLRNEPFKLDRLPLVKFWLVRVGEKEHILYRAIHHIIVDAWSWKVFFNEVGQLYRSRIENQKNPLPVAPQYADYAARQQEVVKLDSPRYVESLLWWSQRLKYPPRPLHLPFTRRKPFLEAKPTDGIVELPISSEVSRRLDQIAATCGATHYSVRFAVLVAALAELTGRRDLIVGAYSTGRRRLELQNMFGMFANLMTLRLRWNPRYTFVEWLASVHQVIAETREHAEIPYGVLCDGLRMKGIQPPAIQAIVATVDRFAPNTFGTVTLSTPERLVEVMPWGFSLLIVQNTADLWRAEFDTRRYDPDAVLPFLVRCQELFELFSLQPQRILSEIVRPVRVPPDAWLDNQQSPWTHFTLSTALRIRHRLQHLLRAA